MLCLLFLIWGKDSFVVVMCFALFVLLFVCLFVCLCDLCFFVCEVMFVFVLKQVLCVVVGGVFVIVCLRSCLFCRGLCFLFGMCCCSCVGFVLCVCSLFVVVVLLVCV